MSEYRIEKDSLGEVRVPKGAYYAAQTQRAVENFPITGLKPWPAFIWSMAVIKRAAAEVHKDLGLLDGKLADAIIQAGEEVLAGQFREHFVVDPFQAGAGTSHNIINTGGAHLKLYTIYSPPNHRDGVVHPTRADAEADTEKFDGKTTE